jgi:ElaB/YqjD/DUF883 family membrane-anchored ribosome-binding protein
MATETTAKVKSEVAEMKQEAMVEKLTSDVAALRADLSQVLGSLKQLGVHSRDTAVEEGRRQLLSARDEFGTQVDHLRSSAEEYTRQATDAVRERPGQALLIAAVIGMLFGFLTARK